MYLFTRAGRLLPGSVREGIAFATTINEKVHQETGLDLHTWGASMSPELGTVVWATIVDTLEDLEAAEDKLAVSDAFGEMAERGAKLFAGPLRDGLAQFVTEPPDRTAALPSYVTVARAVTRNGQASAAFEAGVEIAEAATRITGVPTAFLADVTGDYGGCRWQSGHPDIGSVQRSEAALLADESWLALIDRAGPLYAQGVTQSMYRRII